MDQIRLTHLHMLIRDFADYLQKHIGILEHIHIIPDKAGSHFCFAYFSGKAYVVSTH